MSAEQLVVVGLLRPGRRSCVPRRRPVRRARCRRSGRPGAGGGRPRTAVASQSSRISSARPIGDDAAAHGQHVGVVVLAATAGGVEVVAERGPHAVDLVGGDLLALARCRRARCRGRPRRRRPPGRRRRRSAGSRPTRCRAVPRSSDLVAQALERRRRGASSGRSRRGRPRSRPSCGALPLGVGRRRHDQRRRAARAGRRGSRRRCAS